MAWVGDTEELREALGVTLGLGPQSKVTAIKPVAYAVVIRTEDDRTKSVGVETARVEVSW